MEIFKNLILSLKVIAGYAALFHNELKIDTWIPFFKKLFFINITPEILPDVQLNKFTQKPFLLFRMHGD